MIIDKAFKNELAAVTSQGVALSKEKETPYVWFQFQFENLEGPEGEPVTVRADLYMTDKSIEYTLQKLAVLGWTGRDISELDPESQSHHNFVGVKALLTGEMQPYKGKTYPKVIFINDPDYIPQSPIEKKELDVLNAKLAGKIAAYRAKSSNTVPTKSKKNNEDVGKILAIEKQADGKPWYITMESGKTYTVTADEHKDVADRLWKEAKRADVEYRPDGATRVVVSIDAAIPF